MSYRNSTQTLDLLLYDSLQRFSQMPPADDLIIIDIDEKSIDALGRWPWSRKTHAELLNKLTDAGSSAVLLDIIFSDTDQSDPSSDNLFAKAIARNQHVILPLFIKQVDLHGQVIEVPPAPVFYRAAQSVGHVHVSPDSDGVIRSVFLKEGVGTAYWPHASLAILELLGRKEGFSVPGAQSLISIDEDLQVDSMHLISRDYLNYLPMPGDGQGLRHYSYVDVVSGNVDPQSLANKIVFVGAVAAGLGDIFTTSVGSMAGVELNAWMFHALRSEAFIQKASNDVQGIVNGIIVFLSLLLLGRLSPRSFLTGTSLTIISLVIVSASLQLKFQQWLSVIPAIIAIVIFYPLWNWRRLELALNFLREELNELTNSIDQEQYLIRSSKKEEKNYRSVGSELITRTIDQLTEIKFLANANRRLIQQSLSELQDAVVISDLDGNIMLSNKAFNDLTETESKTLINTLESIKLGGNQQWIEIIRRLNKEKKPFTIQGVNTISGKDLYCQGRLVSVGHGVEDTSVITLTDVSQLKAAEKSRSEALSFLSHDLRSPMVSVLAIIERQRALATIDQEVLDPIERLVRKNLDYADSFLQLSRAESLQSSQLLLCDLHAVFDTAQMHAMALAESKQIKLMTARMNSEAWIMAEADLLERAIINLLSNAIKYSPDGSTINFSLTAHDDEYRISVVDQGCGIAEEDMPTLFERFTRSGSQAGVSGAGLGLNFVSIVAERHQASIQVESVLGKGSCFTLALKAVDFPENNL
jgi:CHASE2 domain-containing sensor protein/nitrogen-specific signal transduction histidine kinase